MPEYTGNYFELDSEVFEQKVNCLEYKCKSSVTWGNCYRCGKPLRRHWWTIQTVEDDLVICDIGPDCIKKLT